MGATYPGSFGPGGYDPDVITEGIRDEWTHADVFWRDSGCIGGANASFWRNTWYYHVFPSDCPPTESYPDQGYTAHVFQYLPKIGDPDHWDYDGDGIPDGRDPDPGDPTSDFRSDLNLGWGDDGSVYCPIKVGENSVNVATGNHTEGVVDLSVSGPGVPLSFFRFYNSRSSRDGPLGVGWSHG